MYQSNNVQQTKFIVFMAATTESVSCYQDTICNGPQQLATGRPTAAALHHVLLINCTPERVPLHVQRGH